MKRFTALAAAAALALGLGMQDVEARDGHHSGAHRGHHHGHHGHGHHHGHHHRHHGHWRGSFGIVLGAPLWYDPWPSYRYRYAAPVVIERSPPPVYVQQEPNYWYYCTEPAGYYPYVGQCNKPWMKVVPNAPQ